MPMT